MLFSDERPEFLTRPEGEEISFVYQNHRGEVSNRFVVPIQIRFGTAPNRSEATWVLDAWDLSRGAVRSFTLNQINRGELRSADRRVPPEIHKLRAELAEMTHERDEWKRRAKSHGCNVVDGDPECS